MSSVAYPSYSDSNIHWVGRIPTHWKVLPLYALAIERDQSNKGMLEDNLLSLSYGRIIPKDMSSNDGLLPESFETYQIVCPGDIVFRLTDLQNDKRSLRSALVEERGIITSAYVAIAPQGADSRYLSFLFRAYDVTKVFYSMGGGLRQAMKYDDLKRLPVVMPPLAEQVSIAHFLDQETSKIDALISEQQRLIELLKEKRQAVISHAVTKGLNPDVRMKPSGVEWLGEVPEHWTVSPVKHLVKSKNGAIKTGPFGSHLTAADMQVGTVKVYNQRNVIDDDFVGGDNFISEAKFAELESFEVFPGDLVVTTRGTIGRAAIVPSDAERGILHPCLLRLQMDSSKMHPEFIRILIQDSSLMKAQLSYLSNATTIEVIYSNTMACIVVPVPPLEEQKAIVDFINEESSRYGELSESAQRAVLLLQERRTALISAAVTGKIDVRNYAATQKDAA